MNKKTTDLASASTQHKECEPDVSSASTGAPENTNEDESTANANVRNPAKHYLTHQKCYCACCINHYFNKKHEHVGK